MFRRSELKKLLKKVGLAHSGCKADLFHRADLLLMSGNRKVQKRIEKIYKRKIAHLRKPTSSSHVDKDSRPFKMHPDVKFKIHPFYKVLECIVKPTALGKGYLFGYDISSCTV